MCMLFSGIHKQFTDDNIDFINTCVMILWMSMDMTGYCIMAVRAFVVAKEVFIMETIVFWLFDNG